MKLSLAVLAVAGVATTSPIHVNAVQGISDGQWESTYGVLRECMSSMGACLKGGAGAVGLVPGAITQQECSAKNGVWKEPYGSWNAFKSDVNAVSSAFALTDRMTHIAELSAGQTKNSVSKAIENSGADVAVAEVVVCRSGEKFLLLDGSSADISSIGNSIGMYFPLTPTMKKSPICSQYAASNPKPNPDGSFSMKFRIAPATTNERRRLSEESSAGRAFEVLKEWEAALGSDAELEFGSGRMMTDEETGDYVHDDAGMNGVGNVVRVTRKSGWDSSIMDIADKPEVLWAEPDFFNEASNLDAALLVQAGISLPVNDGFENREDLAPFWQAGIRGQGQVVGVGDSGIDTSSCFFADGNLNEPNEILSRPRSAFNNKLGHRKVIQYASFVDGVDGVSGHGSHVAGSIAGSLEGGVNQPNGNVDDRVAYQGMAPDAKLAFFDIGDTADERAVFPPNNLETMFQASYDVGARLHSNSWGANANVYNGNSQDVDSFMFDNQDYLVLVAAGNSGFANDGTVGAPATAKSCLSVGAAKNTDHANRRTGSNCGGNKAAPCENNMADFSSSGPGPDGRIKPEVVAPGDRIISTEAGSAQNPTDTCNVGAKSGTSMATPVTAGSAALVRQFLEEGRFPTGQPNPSAAFTPMGSLIKAILINGATPITGDYAGFQLGISPSIVQGFGRIQLSNNVFLEGNRGTSPDAGTTSIFMDGDFLNPSGFQSDGESKTYDIDVIPGQNAILRATLVWSDAPASLGSNSQIINDLDLEVTAPDGTVFFPNGRNSADRINVVEQIELSPEQVAAGGIFKVKVSANRIAVTNNQGIQPYSLVVAAAWEDSTPQLVEEEDGGDAAEATFAIAAAGVGIVLVALGAVAIVRGRRHVRLAGPVQKSPPSNQQMRAADPAQSKLWGPTGTTGRWGGMSARWAGGGGGGAGVGPSQYHNQHAAVPAPYGGHKYGAPAPQHYR